MSGNGRSNREGAASYAIQSGLPVPARKATQYPWADMLDGDSFSVPCNESERRAVQRRLYVSGRAWCKRNRPAAQIVTRIDGQGVRVWLVEA